MKICMLLTAVLILLVSLTPGDSTVLAPAVGRTVEEKACDELRRELATLLRLVYDKKAWPNNFKKLLPHWVESHMPASCGKRRSYRRHINRPSTDAKGVYAMSSKIRHAREVGDGNFENEVHRLKRSILTAAEDQLKAMLRYRRNTHGNDASNHKDGSAVLYRQKRFMVPGSSVPAPDFASMSLGSANPGPGREISESAQMMSNLMMLTKLQKSRVAQEYRNIGRNRYIGDRVSFGSGIYGDSYPGKRKRELENYIAYNEAGMGPDALAEAKLRRKRFMFVTEPSEVLATPSLFSIYQGTALDPNTGKRLEFGGDVMKRAFGSTLMSFLPPGFQQPPGREPGDFIKTVAPLLLHNSASLGSAQKQNRNGLFGDTLPGKKRRKRSPDGSYKDVFRFGEVPADLFGRKGEAIQPEATPTLVPPIYPINHTSFSTQKLLKSLFLHPYNNNKLWKELAPYYKSYSSVINLPPHLLLERNKRSTNSDVVTIGDVTIPVDFFKPQDKYSYDDSRSEQDSSPPAPQPQQNSTKAALNTRHIHHAYQSIIDRYRQALSNSQYNNLYLYKVLHKPVVHQLLPVIYQTPPIRVPHPPRYPTYLPPISMASHQRPLFNLPPAVPVQQTAPILQPQPSLVQIPPVPFQPQLPPPPMYGLPPIPLNPPPSFPLNLPSPLPLAPPPPPPFIQPPLTPPSQPQPPILYNPLPPINNFPPQQNFMQPITNQYPTPPVDPFLQLTPQPRAQRIKRSKDSSDKSSNSYFSPSLFPIIPPSIFTSVSYIPQLYSPQSSKLGHRSPSGDIIYGDLPLWQRQTSSSLPSSPIIPPSIYSATNANSRASFPTYNSFSINPSSPLASIRPPPSSFIPPLLSSTYQSLNPSTSFNPLPRFHHLPQQNFISPISSQYPSPPVDPFLQLTPQARAQRIKRSKDSSDKSSSSYFSPSLFPIIPPSIFTSIPYIPQLYSPQSSKLGLRSQSGDIIYGDIPSWQHQSSSSLPLAPPLPPSRYSATETNSQASFPIYSSSFSLNPPTPLAPIPSPQSSTYQSLPPSPSFNPLPPFHHSPLRQNFIRPVSSQYPSPPVDPLLQQTPQARAQRIKRSKDSSDKSSRSYNFSPSLFPIIPPSIFTSIPNIPQLYSPQSSKIGHRSQSGDIIYGDIPSWHHQTSSSLLSKPLVPPLGYSASNTNSHASSLASNLYQLPVSLTRSVLPQLSSVLHSPANTLPLVRNTPGGVIYGDRLPWSGSGTPRHAPGPYPPPQPPQVNTLTQGRPFG